MAKTTKLKGFDDYLLLLRKLDANVVDVTNKALYEGTKIMADALKGNIQSLTAVNELENLKAYRKKGKMQLSEKQKQGLLNSMGVAPFINEGTFITSSVGFDGYNEIKTKKYPKGQPNLLIARILESGSSYMDKTPFIRKTINRNRKTVEEEMRKVYEEEIEKIMKG